ncbi:MAG: membrane protein insertion efficiency factor YidD [Planctomycetales bacterium]|nr:membrane protein insertion efficiency factor YidD [Planctomycetales bacterium]
MRANPCLWLFAIASRVLGRGLILTVQCYQLLISPWLGPNCRFEPTCSSYFIQAVRKYGPFRGAWRGVRRILRCHPWGASGYDPP